MQRLALLTLIVAVVGFSGRIAADESLCEHVILKEGKLKLDQNEKILICGTPKSVDGWREVPLPQAQYALNVLLQNQGFLEARFERDQQTLYVWSGPRKRTQSLEVHGADGLLSAGKKRKVVGFPMEPGKLDEVQQWAMLGLRRQGYACPEVKIAAQQWDGKVIVDVNTGDRQTINRLDTDGMDNLDSSTLARFQAFEVGQEYNVIDTDLTASRMLDQGLFQSAYITNACHADKVDLHLFTSVGKPRLFRFGFGASTEEFPFVDIWFKNTRLDNRASNFTATAHASNLIQRATVDGEFYVLPFTKRTFFAPHADVGHDKETSYEYSSAKAGVDLGRSWDSLKLRNTARLGPSYNFFNSVAGLGPSNAKFLSLDGSLETMSHAYEEFQRDQFEGWKTRFSYHGQREHLGSSINVDRYQADLKHLWNLGAYSPPLFVLATRAQAVLVDTKSDVTTTNTSQLLPQDYRVYYGGDDTLRGFSRQSLNNDGLGYLTSVYLGLELRLIEELPYHLQPFLLYDVARLGARRDTLEQPLYVSPGLGLRWASPFGTLRGSAAKGRIYHEDQTTQGYAQEWVYFVSFGQEF